MPEGELSMNLRLYGLKIKVDVSSYAFFVPSFNKSTIAKVKESYPQH